MHAISQDEQKPSLWPRLRASLAKQNERLLSIPSELAIRGMYTPVLGRSLVSTNHMPVAGLRSERIARLEPAKAEIVHALDRDGMFVTSLDALGLPDTGAMFDDAARLSLELTQRAALPASGTKHTLTASADDLLRWKRVMRWALDETLLDVVEAYLGAPAAYDCPLFLHSKADGREEGVRLWHRDREDISMVKVAIYMNDVDDDGGPFQVLTPDLQRQIDRRGGWRYKVMRQANRPTQIRESDWATGVRSVTGARGTVIFVDTARLHHRGKPPTVSDRSAIFHSFFSRRPRHPFCCERSPLSRRQIAEFAKTLPERERDCVMWRSQLPFLQRLIPRNRLTI